jgi:methionyl-tRNA synthetase
MDLIALAQYIQSTPWLLASIIAWGVLWKGIALWYAARNNQPAWYIFLIIINTAGILEIIYLLFFRRRRPMF